MYRLVRRTKIDDVNRRVLAYLPKSSDNFLKLSIFQNGSEAEYQALEQLASVLDKEVINTANGSFT